MKYVLNNLLKSLFAVSFVFAAVSCGDDGPKKIVIKNKQVISPAELILPSRTILALDLRTRLVAGPFRFGLGKLTLEICHFCDDYYFFLFARYE